MAALGKAKAVLAKKFGALVPSFLLVEKDISEKIQNKEGFPFDAAWQAKARLSSRFAKTTRSKTMVAVARGVGRAHETSSHERLL